MDDDSLRELANSRFAEKINAMHCIHFEISENATRLTEQYIHSVPTLIIIHFGSMILERVMQAFPPSITARSALLSSTDFYYGN